MKILDGKKSLRKRIVITILVIVSILFWWYLYCRINSISLELSSTPTPSSTHTIAPRSLDGRDGNKGDKGEAGINGERGITGAPGTSGTQEQPINNFYQNYLASPGSISAIGSNQDAPTPALSGGGPSVYGLDGNGTSGTPVTITATWPADAGKSAIVSLSVFQEWQVGVPLSGPGLIRLQIYGSIKRNGVTILPLDMASTGFDVDDTWSLSAMSPDVFINTPSTSFTIPKTMLEVMPGDTIEMHLVPSTEVLSGTFVGMPTVYGVIGSLKLDPVQ